MLTCVMLSVLCVGCGIGANGNTGGAGGNGSDNGGDVSGGNSGGTGGTDGGEGDSPTAQYVRVNADGTDNADGEYVKFGSYPQSRVTNVGLIQTLNAKTGALPTSADSKSWTSYKYFVQGGNATDFMWYQDVLENGEKYRAVYFTSYKPYWASHYDGGADKSCQDENGYTVGNVYWFKFEPLLWKILSENVDEMTLLSESILTAREWDCTTDVGTNSVNTYANSSIRAWLNGEFYSETFSAEEKAIIKTTIVDNGLASTGDNANGYVCANTQDKVFLPSFADTINGAFGFSTNADRIKKPTEYAKSQGVWVENVDGYGECGYWWLRTPYYDNEIMARLIGYDGTTDKFNGIDDCCDGVVPAITIIK